MSRKNVIARWIVVMSALVIMPVAICHADKEKDALRENVTSLQADLDAANAANTDLREMVETLQDDLEKVGAASEKAMADKEADLTRKIADLQKEIGDLNALNDELRKTEEKAEDLEKKLAEAAQQLSETQSELQAKSDMMMKSKKEASDAQGEATKAKNELAALRDMDQTEYALAVALSRERPEEGLAALDKFIEKFPGSELLDEARSYRVEVLAMIKQMKKEAASRKAWKVEYDDFLNRTPVAAGGGGYDRMPLKVEPAE